MLTECPNCPAIWGFDEIEDQRCDACGYPDNMDEEDEEYFDPSDDAVFGDDINDDSNDPNDSRNL